MTQSLQVAGNTGHTRPENRAFYPGLDGLRAIAFLTVFSDHYLHLPWGWAGVNIFFVLSGFLITGILFDSRDDAHRVRNFYVRRTLRIFPLYYGIFLVLLLLAPAVHWQWNWLWLVWPAYLGNYAGFLYFWLPAKVVDPILTCQLTATQSTPYLPLYLGHFWTLCVEEQFYLVWPGIVFWVRDRRILLVICAASLPLCLSARIVGAHLLPRWLLHTEVLSHATPFSMDNLLLGGLLALLLRGVSADALLRLARLISPYILAALLCWFVLTPAHRLRAHPYRYPASLHTWGFSVIALLSGLLILLAIQQGSVFCRVLSLSPLRWMGRISYGAYVFHDIFHEAYVHLTDKVCAYLMSHHEPFSATLWAHRDRVTAAVAFLATLLLAQLSFRFFETPFLNLKERWTVR